MVTSQLLKQWMDVSNSYLNAELDPRIVLFIEPSSTISVPPDYLSMGVVCLKDSMGRYKEIIVDELYTTQVSQDRAIGMHTTTLLTPVCTTDTRQQGIRHRRHDYSH